jgi:hypothetical protein
VLLVLAGLWGVGSLYSVSMRPPMPWRVQLQVLQGGIADTDAHQALLRSVQDEIGHAGLGARCEARGIVSGGVPGFSGRSVVQLWVSARDAQEAAAIANAVVAAVVAKNMEHPLGPGPQCALVERMYSDSDVAQYASLTSIADTKQTF